MFTTEQLLTLLDLRQHGYMVVSQTQCGDGMYRLVVQRTWDAPCVELTLEPDGSYAGTVLPRYDPVAQRVR